MTDSTLELYGMLMSPYSMKMRAYLRYRRIPFNWRTGLIANHIAETKVQTYMIPVIGYPDGTFENDSTPIIDKLEASIAGRRTEPENEADAFLAYLIEDFADEWLLWPFFINRWGTSADQKHNSHWILYEALHGNLTDGVFEPMAEGWASRQIDLVKRTCGSPANDDILNESLHAFLRVMESTVTNGLFFFGSRPSRAEIAIYGILSQLIQDLSPSADMRENYTFTTRWVSIIDDLSGIDGEWEALSTNPEKLMATPVAEILKMSGKYHLPLLHANAEAMDNGEQYFSFDIDGRKFERETHERHITCLPAPQKRYADLSSESKAALKDVLEESACLNYLAAGN